MLYSLTFAPEAPILSFQSTNLMTVPGIRKELNEPNGYYQSTAAHKTHIHCNYSGESLM